MLCQFYIIITNNRYNNIHKYTNEHDKFYIIYHTNMKASLCSRKDVPQAQDKNLT